jgi:GTP cyclohydrolase I
MLTAVEHIRAALRNLGYDVKDEHFKDTPRRVAEVWRLFSTPPEAPAMTTFNNPSVNQMVVAKSISVAGLCPHHLLPWRGIAHVAYIPHKRIVGISKLVRLAQWASQRTDVQENVGNLIADVLSEKLEPQGVAVVIEATHDCVACRGAKDPNIKFVTSVLRGLYFNNPVTRAEWFEVLKLNGEGGR